MRVDEESGKMIVQLEDTSSNGTYYNGEKVSHNNCSRIEFVELIICFLCVFILVLIRLSFMIPFHEL